MDKAARRGAGAGTGPGAGDDAEGEEEGGRIPVDAEDGEEEDSDLEEDAEPAADEDGAEGADEGDGDDVLREDKENVVKVLTGDGVGVSEVGGAEALLRAYQEAWDDTQVARRG